MDQIRIGCVTRRGEVVTTGKQRVEGPKGSPNNNPCRPGTDGLHAYTSVLGHRLGVPINAATGSRVANLHEVAALVPACARKSRSILSKLPDIRGERR